MCQLLIPGPLLFCQALASSKEVSQLPLGGGLDVPTVSLAGGGEALHPFQDEVNPLLVNRVDLSTCSGLGMTEYYV